VHYTAAMPFATAPHPNARCPFCDQEGMVGFEREVVGTHAVTIYKCHHCNTTWEVPDDPLEAPRLRKKR